MDNAAFYTFNKSTSGEIVPSIIVSESETKALHSMVDPKREAQRLISQIPDDTGCLIFLGLGGGFACEAALDLTQARIIAVDFNKDAIAQLLAGRDYSNLLKNSRFSLFVDMQSGELKKFILESYRPQIAGGIKIIPLRARTEHDREKFEMAAQAIQESIDIITGDYSVQAHFGMRWFSNIIRNAKNPSLCENQAKLPVQVKRAAIAAAGPSLDSQMESIAKMKYEGVYIISTDTASGALVQSGIEPDVIVSIDCQHISYYHFTGSLLREKLRSVPLVLDIASPPLLSGLCAFPVFFASGHPFARYICAQWRSLPQLDTSGGNVTYTCLSLAERLGADHITIFGADFSYIGSRTYARGAYINPYFSARQNRLSALEAQMSSFLYRSPFLAQEGEKKIYRETSSLRHYRRKLEEKASMMQAHVECAKGFGPTVIIENKNCGAGKKEYEDGNIKMNLSGIEFLAQYRDGIASLPKAGGTDDYFNLLNAKEKLIFTTLLPFAAAIRKRNPRLKSADVIEETKKLCVMKIDAVL